MCKPNLTLPRKVLTKPNQGSCNPKPNQTRADHIPNQTNYQSWSKLREPTFEDETYLDIVAGARPS